MNMLCKLTILITQLHCLFSMGNTVSSTIEHGSFVWLNRIISFYFAMRTFASLCFPVELVPLLDVEELVDNRYT